MKVLVSFFVVCTIFNTTAELQSKLGKTSTVNEKSIQYEEYKPFEHYESTVEFDDRGMGPIFKLADDFIHALIPTVLSDAIKVDGNGITIIDGNYAELAENYLGFLVFISFLLLIALVLPIFGICFSCCRCCGNCGAGIKKADDNNSCCKLIGGFLLFAFFVLLLFGIVCAFTTNQQLDDGTLEFGSNMKTSVQDMQNYVKDVSNHSEVLLMKNLEQFSTSITTSLDNTAKTVFEDLKEKTNAVSIDKAVVVARNVDDMKMSMFELEKHTTNIKIYGMQFSDGMWNIEQAVKDACVGRIICGDLVKVIESINTDFNFAFPDISKYTNGLGNINDLEGIVNVGKQNLEIIEKEIEDKIDQNVEDVKTEINDAQSTLKKEWGNFQVELDSLLMDVIKFSDGYLNDVDELLKTISPYRFYVGLAFSLVLLAIAFCLIMGLVCGTCGKMANDEYEGGCCNKGTGGTFLMCGVGLMTTSAFFLVVLLLLHIIGIVPALLVCEPLRSPSDSEVISILDDYVEFEEYFGIGLGDILLKCEEDNSVYEVFNLESKFDLTEIENFTESKEGKEIIAKIDEFIKVIKEQFANQPDIILLTPEMTDNIDKLINYQISGIPIEKFLEPLDEVDEISLKELNNKLEDLIGSSPSPIKEKLELINTELKMYDTHILQEIIRYVKEIKMEVEIIKTTLDSNESGKTFEESLEELLDNIKDAENTWNSPETEEDLLTIVIDFKDKIIFDVEGYTKRVAGSFKRDVGKCKPLDTVIKSVVTSTCDKIVSPMNSFWFSIFWCILFFIPIIIVSISLATIYRKVRPEPLYGQHVVDNYYY